MTFRPCGDLVFFFSFSPPLECFTIHDQISLLGWWCSGFLTVRRTVGKMQKRRKRERKKGWLARMDTYVKPSQEHACNNVVPGLIKLKYRSPYPPRNS